MRHEGDEFLSSESDTTIGVLILEDCFVVEFPGGFFESKCPSSDSDRSITDHVLGEPCSILSEGGESFVTCEKLRKDCEDDEIKAEGLILALFLLELPWYG